MNPVAVAINAELELWRGKREDAVKSVESIDVHINHLENVLRTYQDHPAIVEQETAPVALVPVDDEGNRKDDEAPVEPETTADESPPQQETEASSEEPAVRKSGVTRVAVGEFLEQLDIGEEVTVASVMADTGASDSTVRQVLNRWVLDNKLKKEGLKPAKYRRTVVVDVSDPASFDPGETADDPAPADSPEPLYEPEDEDKAPGSPQPPAEPIGERQTPEDFLKQILDVIKSNGPIAPHEIPTVTGIFDGDALKRATSQLDADGKIEYVDGCWQVASGKSTNEAEQQVETEPAMSEEDRKLREDIVAIVSRRPRTGSQLAEQLSTPIKELDPVLQELKNAGEITRTNFRQWKAA